MVRVQPDLQIVIVVVAEVTSGLATPGVRVQLARWGERAGTRWPQRARAKTKSATAVRTSTRSTRRAIDGDDTDHEGRFSEPARSCYEAALSFACTCCGHRPWPSSAGSSSSSRSKTSAIAAAA